MLRRALALAAMILLVSAPAHTSQDNLYSPTTGTVSGLQLTVTYNNALKALASCNSGSSAPANVQGGPVAGQLWCDTSVAGYLIVRQYDGTSSNWLEHYRLDLTNHVVVRPIGGGAAALASASTTDLWSVPQAAVTVTGTTTVTALASSSAQAGTLKVVTFSGVLTLTHNATSMILPTGANLVTEAGDRAIVLATSASNVAIVGYTRASGAPLFNSATPVGVGMDFWGTTPPSGWYFANGQAISRTSCSAAFSALGTTFGVGDGTTTFNLPDKRGRVSAGKNDMGGTTSTNRLSNQPGGLNGNNLGATGGLETHTLTTAQLAAHTHANTLTDPGHSHGYASTPVVSGGTAGGGNGLVGSSVNSTATSVNGVSITNASAGSGDPHNNVQPTIISNHIIYAGC